MGEAGVRITSGGVRGGPLAQADFCGSWVEIFGEDVVYESLLILKRRNTEIRSSCLVKLFRSAIIYSPL